MNLLISCIFVTLNSVVLCTKKDFKPCKENVDCDIGYICGKNQTCGCDPLHVINNFGDKCLAGVGQKCRYDEHCVNGAYCELQKVCQCKDDLEASDDGFACSHSTSYTFANAVSILISLVIQQKFC